MNRRKREQNDEACCPKRYASLIEENTLLWERIRAACEDYATATGIQADVDIQKTISGGALAALCGRR